jgi:very-short-patch-repair endonuclease
VRDLEKPVFRTRNTQRSRELRRSAPPAERLLWSKLSSGQVNGRRFTRQFQIGKYHVDLVCRSHKLVIEVDGWSHDSQQEYDMQRDGFMRAHGYRVLRFTNGDVTTNLEGVVLTIAQALDDLPSPNPSRKREGD